MRKEAHRDTFTASSTRLMRDQAIVEGQLPSSTRYLSVGGVRGWLYPIDTEPGDRFLLFAYFDGRAYQVKVVDPEVEKGADPHACHLFPDGRICLGEDPTGGTPALSEAYARSVMWCNGYSVYRRTASFPY
jgi:hypothetical protein